MTTTTKAAHRVLVALTLPLRVALLITYTLNVLQKMTGNPAFPTPVPPLAAISAALTDLQTAEAAALNRGKGAAAARNAKRAVLVALLQQLRTYVQNVADASPEQAAVIIPSSGLAVRKTPTHVARTFTATQGALSGQAKVTAVSAGHRASYEWEYSVDGGKTWIAAPVTLQAKTTIGGLAAGTTVQFRNKAVTKGGEGDWGQPVSLIVK
ncbi:MAG TPA: fibronectin type III domain-containing protein [Polyangiaceae bacterium]